jgi:hypothetical protein
LHGITVDESIFYAVVWLVAVLACLSRTLRDNSSSNAWHAVATSFTSGFFAFGCIAVWSFYAGHAPSNPWLLVGASALLGLVGKEQDAIIRGTIRMFWKAAKVAIEEKQKGE